MAEKSSIQGEVEINCPAHKLVEMFRGKQEHVPRICSHRIPSIQAHHGDWVTVGTTTRRWDYVLPNGKSHYLTERIESVDEENNTLVFTIIDGDIMKTYYKTFVSKVEAIGKGNSCLVKWTIEYEKLNEDAPEPQVEMEFLIGLTKDLGDHHAKA